MERYLGIIKIFNIVAGVLIILGIVALVWLVIDRSRGTNQSGTPDGRTTIEDGAIALPAGFTITQMAATSEFLFLLVGNDAGNVLLLRLDPRDPAATASFVIETARPGTAGPADAGPADAGPGNTEAGNGRPRNGAP